MMTRQKHFNIFLMFCLFFSAAILKADVKMPRIFSTNMVLQRNQSIPVWGWADPGEKVTVQLGDESKSTTADDKGTWTVSLKKRTAGGPLQMKISGNNEIIFDNILIGDVWLCSGQSNMELPLSVTNGAEAEIASANFPDIRLFTVPNNMAAQPASDIPSGEWDVCSPTTVPGFSAVGYYFGKDIYQTQKTPIGLISSNWGGTDIETWISWETILKDPDFSHLDTLSMDGSIESLLEKGQQAYNTWILSLQKSDLGKVDGKAIWANPDLDVTDWKTMQVPQLWESAGLPGLNGIVWFRTSFELSDSAAQSDATLSLGPIDDSDETFINGIKVGEMWSKYNTPRFYTISKDLLKPGVNSLVVRIEDYMGGGGMWGKPKELVLETSEGKIPLAGEWLYKVASPAEISSPSTPGPNSYPSLLYNGMIHPLIPYAITGVIWYQGENNASRAYKYRTLFPTMIEDWRNKWHSDFPFLFVQLANYMDVQPEPGSSDWAELREAQLLTLSEKKTAMAVIIDIGEAGDIHPRNKKDVGYRLSLPARKMVYGEDIVYSSPIYDSMKIKDSDVILKFKHAGSGLTAKDKYGYLKGFAIAGEDQVFHWAKAEIVDKDQVKVWNPDIPNPVAVRYGWAYNPDDVNLYNLEGLPASPFRTDKWTITTQKTP